MSKGSGGTLRKLALNLAVLLLMTIPFFPLYVVLVNTLRPRGQARRIIDLPFPPSMKNILDVILETEFLRALGNSVLITGVSIVVLVFIGSMAAYPLARITTKLSTTVQNVFILGLLLPMQFAMIPVFRLMLDLGLLNTYVGIILSNIGYNLALTIFIFTNFIRTIPFELEEAAVIDGASRFGAFWRIVFPLLKSAIVVVIITNLLLIWNDFLSPLLFLTSADKYTIPVMVLSFQGEHGTDLTSMFTVITLSSLPLVLLFIFLQRYFYKGIISGAIK